MLPPFLFISNGAALAAPFLFLSNGGSVCCPRFSSFPTGAVLAAPISFGFDQGQHTLPPFLFVSNRAAVSFSLPPNNGGYLIFSVLINVQ